MGLMLWLKDIRKWNSLDITEKLELLRKHYCTGPCGQSVSVTSTRSETDSSIRDYFDTTVTINDPWGLAQLGRYIILFIIVFVVLIVIAFIIDSIKRRRGIQ